MGFAPDWTYGLASFLDALTRSAANTYAQREAMAQRQKEIEDARTERQKELEDQRKWLERAYAGQAETQARAGVERALEGTPAAALLGQAYQLPPGPGRDAAISTLRQQAIEFGQAEQRRRDVEARRRAAVPAYARVGAEQQAADQEIRRINADRARAGQSPMTYEEWTKAQHPPRQGADLGQHLDLNYLRQEQQALNQQERDLAKLDVERPGDPETAARKRDLQLRQMSNAYRTAHAKGDAAQKGRIGRTYMRMRRYDENDPTMADRADDELLNPFGGGGAGPGP